MAKTTEIVITVESGKSKLSLKQQQQKHMQNLHYVCALT